MEKTERGVVIPLSAGWNDIGAWDALSTIAQTGANQQHATRRRA
jgi:mannose-1-phosphate guanylyltransferase